MNTFSKLTFAMAFSTLGAIAFTTASTAAPKSDAETESTQKSKKPVIDKQACNAARQVLELADANKKSTRKADRATKNAARAEWKKANEAKKEVCGDKQAKSDRICRSYKPTGSNLPIRRCWTRKQYDKMVEEHQRELARGQMSTGRGEGQ